MAPALKVPEALDILETPENAVLSSQLKTKSGERILMGKRVTYSITDKGRRLLEICESFPDEKVKDFMRVTQRLLDTLRIIVKEGPRRVRDFPYNAHYILKRMVDRGLLDKITKGSDVDQLRRMKDEDFTNQEVAEKLDVSLATVQYWQKKLNLKRTHTNLMNRRNNLHQLLEKNGPMPKREAMETLGFNHRQTETILGMFPGEFQKLSFVAGRTKHRSKFYELVKASPVLTLKGDPHVVDFAASHIHLKVETPHDAKTVISFLKWQIGHRQAREVVERLGYHYKQNPHR